MNKETGASLTHLARDEAALRLVPACQGHDLLLVGKVVHVVRVGLELGVGERSRLDAADYLQLSVGQSYLCMICDGCNRRGEKNVSQQKK